MIENLMLTECHSIYIFKPGDIIIRGESLKFTRKIYNQVLGVEQEVTISETGSLRDYPVKFIGISNNIAYILRIKQSETLRLPLPQWSEGWQMFEPPPGMSIQEILES